MVYDMDELCCIDSGAKIVQDWPAGRWSGVDRELQLKLIMLQSYDSIKKVTYFMQIMSVSKVPII